MCLGEALVSYMVNYIHNEEGYLHYLQQLAKLEKTNDKNESPLVEFEIIHFSNIPRPKLGKIKCSRKKSRDEPCTRIKVERPSGRSKNGSLQSKNHDKILFGQVLDRIETRKQLLDDFQDCCSDETSFKSFCNILFEFEENLIRDT